MTEYASLKELFDRLNTQTPYVILRNFETLSRDVTEAAHPDIDLLCERRDSLLKAIDTVTRGKEGDLIHRRVRIACKDVDLDLREVGDGYLDPLWAQAILKNRLLSPEGFYIPNNQDYYYSLLYHVLVQKKSVASDYREKLKGLARQVGAEGDSFLLQLEDYMRAAGYRYTYPKPSSTAFYVSSVSKDLIEKSPAKWLSRLIHKLI